MIRGCEDLAILRTKNGFEGEACTLSSHRLADQVATFPKFRSVEQFGERVRAAETSVSPGN